MGKTNKKLLFKDAIDKLKNDWLGGSHIVLKIMYMVPRWRQLISIGCKYNYQKVLYLISTEEEGITNASINYLSKYPGKFDNVANFSYY